MGILLWLLFGALAGWLASLIMKTNDQQGALADIIIGIVGAFIGGYLSTLVGLGDVTGFNIPSLLVAVLGSVVLIAIIKAVKK